LRTSKTSFPCCPPGNYVSLLIRHGDDNIVKTGGNVDKPFRLYMKSLSSLCFCFCHYSILNQSAYLVIFFLLATVFFRPFRVRALVLVRCPLTGRPLRCRNPR